MIRQNGSLRLTVPWLRWKAHVACIPRIVFPTVKPALEFVLSMRSNLANPQYLDAEKCGTCLACLTVCPVGAYSADDAVTSLLNSIAHLEGDQVELLCAKNEQADKGTEASSTGIQVRGCLAGLGTGTYLALAALGLEHVILRTEACSACEWVNLRPEIKSQVDRAEHFLAAWDKAAVLTCVSTLENAVDRPLVERGQPSAFTAGHVPHDHPPGAGGPGTRHGKWPGPSRPSPRT